MRQELSRRAMLAGAVSVFGSAVLAKAPEATLRPAPRGELALPPPSLGADLVRASGLSGEVAYAVADAGTGELLDSRAPNLPLPPASTLKAVTALYALDRLGPAFSFETRLLATGPIVSGRLEGDLVLAGGGDPTLDTDRLAALAMAAREAGVTEVTGRFLVWPGALPRGDRIDADQPDHVSYNPAFGGLNLNFNRVHFEWVPRGKDYDLTLQARALRFSPATQVARVALVDRRAPVYVYSGGQGVDRWTVARKALGKKKGARWLPVRNPALYAGDVFRTLARSNGIILGAPHVVETLPPGEALATVRSDPLIDMLGSMMRYSTNLTAECAGLAASLAGGVPVADLLGSGSRMAGWAETRFGVKDLLFRDHSGLGYGSAISAGAMVEILRRDRRGADLMKKINLPGDRAGKEPAKGTSAVAKTGTLNFVSSLAGYLTTASGRRLVFAILTADTPRRDAIPPEHRERPPGARRWARHSRGLQKALLARWAEGLDAV